MTTVKESLVLASKNFLVRKEYELISNESSFDIVAYDTERGCLCFINVFTADEGFHQEAIISREQFEAGLLEFIANNPDEMERLGSDCQLRYDEIEVLLVNATRAILGHHIAAFDKED